MGLLHKSEWSLDEPLEGLDPALMAEDVDKYGNVWTPNYKLDTKEPEGGKVGLDKVREV